MTKKMRKKDKIDRRVSTSLVNNTQDVIKKDRKYVNSLSISSNLSEDAQFKLIKALLERQQNRIDSYEGDWLEDGGDETWDLVEAELSQESSEITGHTVIGSWKPMEVELSLIRQGHYDNKPSLFNLEKERQMIDKYQDSGQVFRSPFHIARESIYEALLEDKHNIRNNETLSPLVEAKIVKACKLLYEFNGFDGANHKRVWGYIPHDAHFQIVEIWDEIEKEMDYLNDEK